jgi:carbamoyl-phosphate synthase small subunit
VLVLEDGTTFSGESIGAIGVTTGEAVFTTGMTGYQETLTDPSYHRQIVVQTAVHIGNTGLNDEDNESEKIWVAGYVMRETPRPASSWRAKRDLEDQLIDSGVVGIGEVDTRAITKKLRDAGAMRAGVFSGTDAARPLSDLLTQVRATPAMSGCSLSGEVSRGDVLTLSPASAKRFRVLALDAGIKQGIVDQLLNRGVEVLVAPAETTLAEIKSFEPDGVMLSNGPGDPATADDMVEVVKGLLADEIPTFGVCFGNQLLGRALGLETYKLLYGHRGLNLPVRNTRTNKVEITTHNHGFAVRAPIEGGFETDFGRARVSHVCLNDDVVEGLVCESVPAFSVQYHPEANAGPHDSAYLFDDFLSLLTSK